MLNIAICDDDKSICSQIENILINYLKSKHIKADIDVFYSGESLLEYIKQGNKFDLIYLDIELDKINGVEVGRVIRKEMNDYTTEIVYISGNDKYDRQLFDVQPLHFIPKPISANIIIEDLNLALIRSQKTKNLFKYKKDGDNFKVPINNIIYFESLNREIKIVLIDKEDSFYGNITDVFEEVSKYHFVKIHRSYVINYNHATVFKYDEVIMSNGSILPISQSRRKEIRKLQMSED